MVLDMISQNAENTSRLKFKETVFAIWDNSLSIPARKRLLASLELSDLKPIGFTHENSASAVYFSMDRNPTNMDSDYVLFINVGSLGTKLSLFNFHA